MLFKRDVLQKIIPWFSEKEIIILNGVRQVGKTSLLKLITQELKNNTEFAVSADSIFYLTLEDFDILNDLNKDPENLLKYITNNVGKSYFLIDEIQYLDNPSHFLKYIYDKYAETIKLIVTGSSSLELKAQLQDSLAGRKVSFLIAPLTFTEYLFFKKSALLPYYNKSEIPTNIKKDFDIELEEYLLYGGMPAVVLQQDYAQKQKLLREYISTYINKDIRAIGNISNISQFNIVIKILAAQIGGLLNISEVSNATNTPRRSIDDYIDLLEHTFVLSLVRPYYSNVKKQMVKMPKLYFFDTGIRNALLGNFSSINSRQDGGDLFENFIYLELRSMFNEEINFYRTVAKAEVDFVFERNLTVCIIEVKYKNLKKTIDTRTMRGLSVANEYTKKMFVINKDLKIIENGIKYMDYRLRRESF